MSFASPGAEAVPIGTAVATAAATPEAPQARRLPGEAGIWLFVFGDLMMFTLFFVIFLHARGPNVELFAQSQAQLNPTWGVLNMGLMLTSSWFVAMAVHSARQGPGTGRATPMLLLMALGCGAGFGVVKLIEYAEKIGAGITLTSNDFFMYYFMFTGIHFVHVLLGMGVLAFLVRATWNGPPTGDTVRHLESGASFWHLVDLLWIVLFALLYLVK
jgi:nitric oxide reductase NorE protein